MKKKITTNNMTVSEKIIKIVADIMAWDPKQIKPEKTLVGNLGADSLDKIEIVSNTSIEFNIKFDDLYPELKNDIDIKTLVNIVEYKQKQKELAAQQQSLIQNKIR